MKKGKKLDHQGIKVELIGRIETVAGPSNEFIGMAREIEPSGQIHEDKNFSFAFNRIEKQFETYHGIGVRLRYIIKATIKKSYKNKTCEQEFVVHNPQNEIEENASIKMEVGIEE